MPKMGNIGVANAGAFGYTTTSLEAPYFISYYNATAANQAIGYPIGIQRNSNGFIYVGSTIGTTVAYPGALGINQDGTLSFQNKYSTSAGYITCSTVDSSGNFYAVGSFNTAQPNAIYKYIQSGTSPTGAGFNTPTSNSGNYGCFADSSGNIHVVGNNGATTNGLLYTKYNSSLAVQSQFTYTPAAGTTIQAGGITVDSSGNIYLVGYVIISSVYYLYVIKLDSTGAFVWQNKYQWSGTVTMAYQQPVVDSSGNIYFVSSNTATYTKSILTKLNSSGVEQWSRSIGFSAYSFSAGSLSIDKNSTYLYISGLGNETTQKVYVVKYDLSGTKQWARSIGQTTNPFNSSFVTAGTNAYFLAANETISSLTKTVIASLPADGTKTGTYTVGGQSYIYASATLTETSTSFTATSFTTTKATSTFTSSSISLSPTATTATYTSLAIT